MTSSDKWVAHDCLADRCFCIKDELSHENWKADVENWELMGQFTSCNITLKVEHTFKRKKKAEVSHGNLCPGILVGGYLEVVGL